MPETSSFSLFYWCLWAVHLWYNDDNYEFHCDKQHQWLFLCWFVASRLSAVAAAGRLCSLKLLVDEQQQLHPEPQRHLNAGTRVIGRVQQSRWSCRERSSTFIGNCRQLSSRSPVLTLAFFYSTRCRSTSTTEEVTNKAVAAVTPPPLP